MKKFRVVLSAIWYPLCMASYFIRAFERREDVELVSVGPFTGDYIPWTGGMRLPMRYVKVPTIPLPPSTPAGLPPSIVQSQLPWEPDLWLQIDAGWWMQKPKAGVVAHIGTDPHVLDYSRQRRECDIFFSMQRCYSQNGDRYLPYAYDPTIHHPIQTEKRYDACLIGLHYENRNRLVEALRAHGYNVYYSLGEVYDENCLFYNESRVALNWSSLDDLNARTFEALGMGLALLTNRVPDLPTFFVERDHYLGFDNLDEAVSQFEWLMAHPEEAEEMGDNAQRKAKALHTYDMRVEQILDSCKLI